MILSTQLSSWSKLNLTIIKFVLNLIIKFIIFGFDIINKFIMLLQKFFRYLYSKNTSNLLLILFFPLIFDVPALFVVLYFYYFIIIISIIIIPFTNLIVYLGKDLIEYIEIYSIKIYLSNNLHIHSINKNQSYNLKT